MPWRTYNSGEVIFREGERSDAAYWIVSGRVQIVKGHGGEKPKTIAVVGAGEYIGEMGVIDDQTRSATAVAEGRVVCNPVTPDDFMELILKHPEEAVDLLKVLFERLRTASNLLASREQDEA